MHYNHQVEAEENETIMSPDQFEANVNEYYKPLFRFALSLTRTESDAGDLTQQAFYVLSTKGHQLRDFTKVKTWLFTTLYRACLEARRRQTRFPHHELDDVVEELPSLDPDGPHRAECSQVLQALSKVDEVFLGCLTLFYLEDHSYKEIAEILSLPLGTVKSRIARGIAQLRELLLPEFGDPNSENDAVQTIAEAGERLPV